MYRPKRRFSVPMALLTPKWETANGVRKKVYPTASEIIHGSFVTYGGTETTVNGVSGLENTAVVESYFRPDIKADCRILLLDTGEVYEIMGQPENIEMRNKFVKFKVKALRGKP